MPSKCPAIIQATCADGNTRRSPYESGPGARGSVCTRGSPRGSSGGLPGCGPARRAPSTAAIALRGGRQPGRELYGARSHGSASPVGGRSESCADAPAGPLRSFMARIRRSVSREMLLTLSLPRPFRRRSTSRAETPASFAARSGQRGRPNSPRTRRLRWRRARRASTRQAAALDRRLACLRLAAARTLTARSPSRCPPGSPARAPRGRALRARSRTPRAPLLWPLPGAGARR